jgi:large subunit ribosomal protein L22
MKLVGTELTREKEILEALMEVPGVRARTAMRALRMAGVKPDKLVNDLSARDFEALENALEMPRASVKMVRVSSSKANQVLELIRGKRCIEALSILKFTPRKAARIVEKVLKSAMANAEDAYKMDTESLFVKKAVADQGPTMRRIMPKAMGRATRIRKRTSHITLVLKELGTPKEGVKRNGTES